jgi:hypothetical protein
VRATKKDLLSIIDGVATVDKDPSDFNRGWYISLESSGVFYLDADGMVTRGVCGFWDTKEDAKNFLSVWKEI